jgi:hypothetical protein
MRVVDEWDRETGTERLEEAVTAFSEALKQWTQAAAPQQYKNVQMNLGRAHELLAQRRNEIPT